MAKPKEGYELLQVTVSHAAVKFIRLVAAMEGATPGQVVDRMITANISGSPLESLVASSLHRSTEPHKTAPKAPGRPQEAPKSSTASEETRAGLWLALESARVAEGWTDGDVAKQLGIAAPNIVQWRRKGMISGPQVAAVTRLLQEKA